MATMKWFVVENDNEVGPLGPNGLRRLVREGRIKPDTLVRREDHQFLVQADHVRGLFDVPPVRVRHADPRPMMHGPFQSLRSLGWGVVATMVVWLAVGGYGVVAALGQREQAAAIAADASQDVPLLGLGAVPSLVLFLATGVLFLYWLWTARVNLPHLIHARAHFAPSMAIGGWFVPLLNLWRPFEVLDEVDRLSAEAAADGNAAVAANRGLLVPWWLSTVAVVAVGARYEFMSHGTVDAVTEAATWHLGGAVLVALAALLAASVVLRITSLQERAHAAHGDPVSLQHVHGHRGKVANSATG